MFSHQRLQERLPRKTIDIQTPCTYCRRAFAKERCKSRCCKLLSKKIKICERYFLCHSIVICQTCNQYPSCCLKSSCRGNTTKLLENLESSGCWSESIKHSQTRLHPPFSDKVTHRHKLLCQSSQEPLPWRHCISLWTKMQ